VVVLVMVRDMLQMQPQAGTNDLTHLSASISRPGGGGGGEDGGGKQ
jgi:hypothetical protein